MTTSHYANARSPKLERAILSVLFDGRYREAIAILMEVCPDPDAFTDRDCNLIARVVYAMARDGQRIEFQALMAQMLRVRFSDVYRKGEAIAFVDGLDLTDSLHAALSANAISEIYNEPMAHSAMRKNCEYLAEFHRQRRLIDLLAAQLEDAKDVGGAERAAKIGDQVINGVATLLGGTVATTTMDEAMGDALRRHDAAKVKGEARRATWGVPALDRKLPMRAGRLIALAAAPGKGKSSLALQAAQNTQVALGPGSVAIVSREMPSEDLATILISRETGIAAKSIENGWLSDAQRERVAAVQARWAGTMLAIKATQGRCTASDLVSWVRQRSLRSAGKLTLVVVDYLQILDAANPRQSPYDRISEATRALKQLALELRICVLVLSQISREGRKQIKNTRTGAIQANPEPALADLAGSGSIEADADAVVFIWPPGIETGPSLNVELKVAKNRGGSEGSIQAVFHRSAGQVFVEVPPDEPESRAHHAHEPKPEEDKYAAMAAESENP